MTNKPLTLALAAAALLTMAGGRANAAAQVFPTPAGPPVGPNGSFFPSNPGPCPASITIGQIFSPSRTVVPPAIPGTSALLYGNNAAGAAVANAGRTGIGFANNIASSGKASTYQCILGNKLIGPWFFPTTSATAIPNDSHVIFAEVKGSEAISFTGANGQFAVGEKVLPPDYRIQILPTALGGTGYPANTFTGASSLMAVNSRGFLPTDFTSTGLVSSAATLPGGVGGSTTDFPMNTQGALVYLNGNLDTPTAQTAAGRAACFNNTGPAGFAPIGEVTGGKGCGGKFLSNRTPLPLNTSAFPSGSGDMNATTSYGSGLWVKNETSPPGTVEVISITNFWCEIPASRGGCPSVAAPPTGTTPEIPELPPVTPPPVPVPEPASLYLLLLGLAGLGFERWRSCHRRGGAQQGKGDLRPSFELG